MGAATMEYGKDPNTQDICTGKPGQQSSIRVAVPINGLNHYLTQISFNYTYLVGYDPPPGVIKEGSSLQVVLIDDAGGDVQVIYRSRNYTDYPWSKGVYSPPVIVNASIHVPNDGLLYLELRAFNHGRNLNLHLPSGGIDLTFGWSSDVVPNPRPAPTLITPATNALAIRYGALRFALPLTEQRTVQYVWEPFHNVNYNMRTNSTWNYALLRNQSAQLHTASGVVADLPFDISQHPYVIAVKAVRLHGWSMSNNAADEPPPSPVDCERWQCGSDVVTLLLVPYGQTDLRITAFPWL
jgi:hypothetical protein